MTVKAELIQKNMVLRLKHRDVNESFFDSNGRMLSLCQTHMVVTIDRVSLPSREDKNIVKFRVLEDGKRWIWRNIDVEKINTNEG